MQVMEETGVARNDAGQVCRVVTLAAPAIADTSIRRHCGRCDGKKAPHAPHSVCVDWNLQDVEPVTGRRTAFWLSVVEELVALLGLMLEHVEPRSKGRLSPLLLPLSMPLANMTTGDPE